MDRTCLRQIPVTAVSRREVSRATKLLRSFQSIVMEQGTIARLDSLLKIWICSLRGGEGSGGEEGSYLRLASELKGWLAVIPKLVEGGEVATSWRNRKTMSDNQLRPSLSTSATHSPSVHAETKDGIHNPGLNVHARAATDQAQRPQVLGKSTLNSPYSARGMSACHQPGSC